MFIYLVKKKPNIIVVTHINIFNIKQSTLSLCTKSFINTIKKANATK